MTFDRETVGGVVGMVWDAALGLPAEPAAAPTTDTHLLGRVEVAGPWCGEIALGCDEPLARRAAAAFFDTPSAEVTP
ncbi:MAG: hypothetical protein MUF18_04865, partial [Fimbriiglobus sp.]|nr:hypothetical protein [Fimbriiglobus sp.]